MADKFMVNKAHLNDGRYFFGFEVKTGRNGAEYLMVYTTPANERKNSYPHVTIYYDKLKEKEKLLGPGSAQGWSGQGHFFHITMSEYHYSVDSSGKYGRRYADGTWKWMDMGSNMGMAEAGEVCKRFETLLARVIKSAHPGPGSAWGEETGGEKFPNVKSDPVFETKTTKITEPLADDWESIDVSKL